MVLLLLVLLFAGCTRADLHVPRAFQDSPLGEDLARELRRSGRALRVHSGWSEESGQGASLRDRFFPPGPRLFFLPFSFLPVPDIASPELRRELVRGTLFFRGGSVSEGSGSKAGEAEKAGDRAGRVLLVPDPDRLEALGKALMWLQREHQAPPLVVVRNRKELSRQELELFLTFGPVFGNVSGSEARDGGDDHDAEDNHDAGEADSREVVFVLEEDYDPARAAREILGRALPETARSGMASTRGILLLGGAESPGVLDHLSRGLSGVEGARPLVVAESVFRATGARLRQAGVALDGAVVLDLAGALKSGTPEGTAAGSSSSESPAPGGSTPEGGFPGGSTPERSASEKSAKMIYVPSVFVRY
ncbi:hypothetical protein AU468_04630 [Alkalispirochaeta sphaeroplastigenens]|uniref:Uncharacterized protein n=1 Tax=Alkalispirochaeta sphaeroplastigenens TaxID=1187066 RepID=A0A2S4JWP7_9SPIO|nr:hypothetical protein AU468_04630 [Alkalispirochaeta sphaeroplastigenens]